LYEELKGKGLEVVAVNHGDSAEVINKYATENKFSFKIVMGGQGDSYTIGKTYGVKVYPTNYLVDADGKIVWRGVGFSETKLREALEKLGVK
jgi:thiol-disulfide isomerase/thioredoxin